MIPAVPQGFRSRKNLDAFGPGSYTEFRSGSRRGSHFGWRYHICKILPGGVETHSKAPIRDKRVVEKMDSCFGVLTTDDREIIPINNCLSTEDLELIPSNILS